MGIIKAIRGVFSRLAERFQGGERITPEAEYQVEITDELVRLTNPDGSTEELAWDELTGFDVETNELGPLAPDVFWVLHGESEGRGCIIPMGATGDKELLQRLEKLPGFDEEQFRESIFSTSQASFKIWRKS